MKRFGSLKTLLSKNEYTSLKIILIIEKTLPKPVCTYGLQIWGSAEKSNSNKIQVFQI